MRKPLPTDDMDSTEFEELSATQGSTAVISVSPARGCRSFPRHVRVISLLEPVVEAHHKGRHEDVELRRGYGTASRPVKPPTGK